MKRYQATYPIATMCRVLEVSTSGYYMWLRRGASARSVEDAVLTDRIKHYHTRSGQTYGRPRIHEDLLAEGRKVGAKRVGRLMREAGLAGVSRRRKVRTTVRDDSRPAPDLVDRKFVAQGPNELWVADITYVPTGEGFVYLATVLDVWSRRIVGWSMADHLGTDLVLDALDMAIQCRRPTNVVHHSDQGCQYTSYAFAQRCQKAGIVQSMGSVGDCFDNAMAESLFATLECELLDRRPFKTRADARMGIFEFIEGWYNPHRRHSALGQLSPVEFERRAQKAEGAA